MQGCAEVSLYAGDVAAREAWLGLSTNAAAKLIDVRSAFEWSLFGTVDMSSINKKSIMVEWNTYPPFSRNIHFVHQLELKLAATDKNSPLYFLCRSGWRSSLAAAEMAKKGYNNCFNIIYGFEGVQEGAGNETHHPGWKQSGLPWTLFEQQAYAA